jgi:CBS domain-containing protein
MALVKDLLDGKGYEIWSASPEMHLHDALVIMSDKHIGALPVVEDGKLVGIFSERDFARHAVEFSNCLDFAVPVSELMTHPVYYVDPEQTVDDCMAVMIAKNLRHLPVLKESQLIGIISIRDVLKHVLADKQNTIDVLEHFLWVNLI